jgi:hypothetical protein
MRRVRLCGGVALALWLVASTFVSVLGRTMNRMGIGAKVQVYKAGVGIGYGFGSGQPASAHFGIGNARVVDMLVRFPDGSEKSLRGVETDTKLIVDQSRSGF